MPRQQRSVPLANSERAPMRGARRVGPVDPHAPVEVTVCVRSAAKKSGQTSAAGSGEQEYRLPREREVLSPGEYAFRHHADVDDLESVVTFAGHAGLTVKKVDPTQRAVVLIGTATQMGNAFGVELARYRHPRGAYRGRTGPVHIPPELEGVVEAVLGLDSRPQALPHVRFHPDNTGLALGNPVAGAFRMTELAQLYGFPGQHDGSGQCIALIELGGGFQPSDIDSFFSLMNIPKPLVSSVAAGGFNNPGVDLTADVEVTMDIQIAGALAPGAQIVVYFAPNTDAGFINAVRSATNDPRTTVISISWGGAEATWASQGMLQMDQALQAAKDRHITVCCSAGDSGSSDGLPGVNVDFPASSPYALGCGGTRLLADNGAIAAETVWNTPSGGATGGGVSARPGGLPDWQQNAGVPPSQNGGGIGRGVPDVAADADPETGYVIFLKGKWSSIGGTSASAPLWAALVARINEGLGSPLGFANALLYTRLGGTAAFQDVRDGDNGDYQAGPLWDPCTGWGSPNGTELLRGLGG